MQKPSLVKTHWYLIKLLSGNKYTDVWRAELSKIDENLPISNPKLDLHNINTYTKFGENPLAFTQVLKFGWTLKIQMDIQTDRQTHGCLTWNHNIPPQ